MAESSLEVNREVSAGDGDVQPRIHPAVHDVLGTEGHRPEKVVRAVDGLLHLQGGDITEIGGRRQPDDRYPGWGDAPERVPLGNNRPEEYHRGHRPRVMPESFDGRGSWLEFLAHFENCAELNEWRNYEKAQYLRVSLRGPACQYLQTLPAYRRRDYDELVASLGRRFNPENQTELYRAQLRNVQRLEKQTLPELGQEIRRLVRLAYPTAPENVIDALGKDCFIDALEDKDLRWRIYQVKAKTLDEAVCSAVEMESYKKAERQRFQPKKYLREIDVIKKTDMDDDRSKLAAMQRKIDDLVKMFNEFKSDVNNDKPNIPRTRECFNCGEVGHFFRDCRKPRKFTPRSQQKASNY